MKLKRDILLNSWKNGTFFDLTKQRLWNWVLRKYFFVYKNIYTINHKRIALNYFYFSIVSGFSGLTLATLIRIEMASPGSFLFKGDSLKYLQVATSHGLIMVFYLVVPLLFGFLANFLIPMHIGAKDVVFPRLNSIGFWIQPFAFLLIAKSIFLRSNFWNYYEKNIFYINLMNKESPIKNMSIFFNKKQLIEIGAYNEKLSFFNFFIDDNELETNFFYKLLIPINFYFFNFFNYFSESFFFIFYNANWYKRKKIFFNKCSNRVLTSAGWAFITPMSSNLKYTGVGAQDLLAVSVLIAGISTTMSFTNLLLTKRILGASYFKNRRILIPFITIALLLTLRMLAVVTPVLAAGGIMIMLDRHWNTFFFDYNYGGDPILFQHLFWFFGHPEVYILMIPAFGVVNIVFPSSTKRRIGSKQHMIWAIYIMAYMGFIVWGHHMYLVGLDHRTRNIYSLITILISLPATVKVINWTITLSGSFVQVTIPLLFSLSFIFFFLVGGFTGMWLSHVALNISMHDTLYVIAHFHLMLSGGTITSIYAVIYYYYYNFFHSKYSVKLALAHLITHTLGIWCTFLPLFFLGFSGLPRRVHDFSYHFIGWQSLATAGHVLVVLSTFKFLGVLAMSYYLQEKEDYEDNYIPKFYKRIHALIFKIFYVKDLRKNNPKQPIIHYKHFILEKNYFEYEVIKLSSIGHPGKFY